jgi:hypothetical protein
MLTTLTIGNQGSESSFQFTQEESEKSSDDATFTSLSSKKSKDEVVEILAEVSVQRRLVVIEDVLTMCGRDVSDDTSPKTHSNDVSEDSSESNTTMNSIMEEALGFLSRRADEGLWIEADRSCLYDV